MGKLLIGVIMLVVGLLIGAFVGAPMMIGTAAGVGIATGLGAGICTTVQAAQDEGLLSAEQVDQVLTRASRNLDTDGSYDGEIVGSAAQCEEVLANLKEAAAK
ncbi:MULTISPECIES: hypothetical protein [unclassified Meridianimarinicoccus]|uniref:hypothetical protein n=1 Tax=unclassified Meridianimarinicoccus TaxID=2923344 RepID=UPI001865E960|nr:hypothetical protein [Fluviibacterium sp. MJW13]